MTRSTVRCTEWGYAGARSSIIIWLSVCSFHRDGAGRRLSVDADGENRIELCMRIHVGTKQGRSRRIIPQWLNWVCGRGDVPRGRADDAYLVRGSALDGGLWMR